VFKHHLSEGFLSKDLSGHVEPAAATFDVDKSAVKYKSTIYRAVCESDLKRLLESRRLGTTPEMLVVAGGFFCNIETITFEEGADLSRTALQQK
jgi:hypothetical protein